VWEVTELVESVQADLSLNADKTSYLVFRALNKKLPNMPSLFYGTSPLKRVTEVKSLGLYMDEQLNFKRHIEKLRGKSSPMVGMLYKLKFYLPSRKHQLTMHLPSLTITITSIC
jgi:hypothetical protein